MITHSLANQAVPIRMLAPAEQPKATPAETAESFSNFLQGAIDGLAAQEQQVHAATDRFIIGEMDVSELMIVSEQAKLSLQLTAEIRNKVIEAYQEVMRMPI